MNYNVFIAEISHAAERAMSEELISARLKVIYAEVIRIFIQRKYNKVSIVESQCNSIISIVEAVEKELKANACDMLYDLYFKGNKETLKTKLISKGKEFYKMRSANSFTQYTLNSTKEMYHVPFELKYKIANYRYSCVGHPCFYLGESSYVCWEELKRESFIYSNVAMFESTEDLTFIDLSIPSLNKELNEVDLYMLPLIIAVRLAVKRPGENYIPEYDIPQLLMECLARLREEEPNTKIAGIKYTSIYREFKGLLFDRNTVMRKCSNYVILPYTKLTKGVCPIIEKQFKFCGCISLAEIAVANPSVLTNNNEGKYAQSCFGVIEKQLKLQKTLNSGMLTYNSLSGALSF